MLPVGMNISHPNLINAHRIKESPTVAKSRTLYLKSHLKSLKSLKFQNLKSRKVETVISKFLYISASNHVKIGRTISKKLLVKVTNHETS